jgi:aspartyl/glutamyl-tRNA(Asn/Gln) amidotransferase C subunit
MANEPTSRSQVLYLAHLARLRLDDSEVDRMTDDLAAIVAYMGVLSTTDLDGARGADEDTAPTPLREDEPRQGLDAGVALGQSAHAHLDGFLVPSFKDSSA